MNHFITPEALSERIEGLDSLFKAMFDQYKTAISVALEVNNERLLHANNWRDQFNSLVTTLITRTTFEDKSRDIEKKFKEQADDISALKSSKSTFIGIITGITLVLSAAMFILKFIVKGNPG